MAAGNGVKEARNQLALARWQGGQVEARRRLRRLAARVQARALVVVEERRPRAEHAHDVLMGMHAAKIGADARDQARLELERRRAEIVVAETRSSGADAVARRAGPLRPLAGEPEHEVDEVDAAAQDDRIVRHAAAPALADLVQPAVQIVAVEGIQRTEHLLADGALEPLIGARPRQTTAL